MTNNIFKPIFLKILMDEKELVKRIKNSFKAKKSKAEILTGFQKRGYKLAYADKLIAKTKRPKRIIIISSIAIILFFSLAFSAYTIFLNQQGQQISNPLSSFVVANHASPSVQNSHIQLPVTDVSVEQIEITPDFISFLLNEIGAGKLHKNFFTQEIPIINFKIDDKSFYSEIKNEIKTYEGLSESADLQFDTNKQDVIGAIISDSPKEIFKQSVITGKTQVIVKSSKLELFAKGYMKLYESLK